MESMKQAVRELMTILDEYFFSLQSSVCCEIRCSTAKRDELIAAVNEWQIEIKKCLALVLRSLCRSLDVDDNVCEESSSPFTNRSSG